MSEQSKQLRVGSKLIIPCPLCKARIVVATVTEIGEVSNVASFLCECKGEEWDMDFNVVSIEEIKEKVREHATAISRHFNN